MLSAKTAAGCNGEGRRRRSQLARAARATQQGEREGGHRPVLLAPLLELLSPQPGAIAVDCTFGFGGHAEAVGHRLGRAGLLIAIDRDPAAAKRFAVLEQTLPCRTRFIQAPFSQALEALAGERLKADLLYFDLGFSSVQLDDPGRGFAYAYDGPLDMRMDPSQPLTAAEIVNTYPERELATLLRRYGEERFAPQIAARIVARRPLARTSELVEAIVEALPAPARFGSGHPAKRVFQALRIAVNGELEELAVALPRAWSLLAVGGRFGAISFHSLEDRIVKRFLGERARACVCPPELPRCVCGGVPRARLLTKRPLLAGVAELSQNPRAASAKLRAAEKVREEG